MSGLITEIQAAALDANEEIEMLLRKMKLAAVKLNIAKAENWVDLELNGYGSEEVPSYRYVNGRVVASSPYHGWIPVEGPPAIIKMLSVRPVNKPVAFLADLIKGDNTSALVYYDPALTEKVLGKNNQSTGMALDVSSSSIKSILDAVRGKVLDWTINMERQGVMGDKFTFTKKEKDAAQTVKNEFNIGSIGNFTGNMGNENKIRDIIYSENSKAEAKKIISELLNSSPDLIKIGADRNLPQIIKNLDAEISKTKPESSRFSALILDARSALSSATGNILSEGALSLLGKLASILAG